MTISSEIIKVLDVLAEKFGIVIDWTSANVIPYLEELCSKYINYEVTTSVVWMVVALVMCVPSVMLLVWLNKNKDFGVEHYQYLNDSYFDRIGAYVGAILLGIVSFIILLTQVFDIVTCLTFPEMIIIDELKCLLVQ